MADPPLIITVLSGIGFGSLVTAGVTFFGNRWIKSREEALEMSKKKMDAVMSNLPTYGLLAATFSGIQLESAKRKKSNEKPDVELIFSYVCDIMRLKRKIYYDQGGLILDDLDAEIILGDFIDALDDQLRKIFPKDETSRMMVLAEKGIIFHEFRHKIENGEDKQLYEKFSNWYSHLQEDDLLNLESKCSWFHQLLFFELNSIFHRWYNKKPNFSSLSPDLRKYLQTDHEKDPALINNPDRQQLVKRYWKRISNCKIF